MTEEKLRKFNIGKWYNNLNDNGVPWPMLRYNGRGDFIVTICTAFFVAILLMIFFGGSGYHSNPDPKIGVHIVIPGIQSLTSIIATVLPAIGTLIAYVIKRKDDGKAQV